MVRITRLRVLIILQSSALVVVVFLMRNNVSHVSQPYQESRNQTEVNPMHNKVSQPYQESSNHPKVKPNRVHILIISSWRSGSSFLGQLFNVNPNVFYLMEPGWHVWMNFQQGSANSLQMAVRDMLRSIFLCDASVFDSYITPEKRQNLNLFGWALSRALCSPPACDAYSRTDTVSEKMCCKACGTYSLRKVEEACQTYSHIVLKEVRLFNLEALYPLLKDPSLNLKIIHLVRDPRAVFNSRNKERSALRVDNNIIYNNFGKTKYLGYRYYVEREYKLLEEICNSQVRMYEKATQRAPSFLKGRYKMIRFEDLTENPLGSVKELYEFSNLTLTPKLQTWIHDITHGSGNGGKNGSFQVSSRDSVYVSKAWRTTLSISSIQKIQQICREAIDLFGYELVK